MKSSSLSKNQILKITGNVIVKNDLYQIQKSYLNNHKQVYRPKINKTEGNINDLLIQVPSLAQDSLYDFKVAVEKCQRKENLQMDDFIADQYLPINQNNSITKSPTYYRKNLSRNKQNKVSQSLSHLQVNSSLSDLQQKNNPNYQNDITSILTQKRYQNMVKQYKEYQMNQKPYSTNNSQQQEIQRKNTETMKFKYIISNLNRIKTRFDHIVTTDIIKTKIEENRQMILRNNEQNQIKIQKNQSNSQNSIQLNQESSSKLKLIHPYYSNQIDNQLNYDYHHQNQFNNNDEKQILNETKFQKFIPQYDPNYNKNNKSSLCDDKKNFLQNSREHLQQELFQKRSSKEYFVKKI